MRTMFFQPLLPCDNMQSYERLQEWATTKLVVDCWSLLENSVTFLATHRWKLVDYHWRRPQAWLKFFGFMLNYYLFFFYCIGLMCHFKYFVLWFHIQYAEYWSSMYFGPYLDTANLHERRLPEKKLINLSKIQSDFVFLSRCKKFDIIPKIPR